MTLRDTTRDVVATEIGQTDLQAAGVITDGRGLCLGTSDFLSVFSIHVFVWDYSQETSERKQSG